MRRIPRQGDWARVTPSSISKLGMRLWLHCTCGHQVIDDALAFAEKAGIEPETPLRLIGLRLKCSKCGKREAEAWPLTSDLARKPSN